MKVFACKRDGSYSGGLIVVAAKNVEEAFLTAAKDIKTGWLFDWYDENNSVCDDGNIKHCHSHFYPLKEWYEIPMLKCNLKHPMVIAENGYTE